MCPLASWCLFGNQTVGPNATVLANRLQLTAGNAHNGTNHAPIRRQLKRSPLDRQRKRR
jgi:hypothetical protein